MQLETEKRMELEVEILLREVSFLEEAKAREDAIRSSMCQELRTQVARVRHDTLHDLQASICTCRDSVNLSVSEGSEPSCVSICCVIFTAPTFPCSSCNTLHTLQDLAQLVPEIQQLLAHLAATSSGIGLTLKAVRERLQNKHSVATQTDVHLVSPS